MIFSQSGNIMQELFRKASLQSNAKRKDDARLLLDFYENQQEAHILAQIATFYKTPERVIPVSVNVTRKIIRSLASTYIQDATRTIDGTEQDQQIYATVEDSASLPVKMKQASRLTKLCGNTFLRPVWRNGKLDLDLLTPDLVDVFCGDSPENIETVLVTLFSDSGKAHEIEYSLWTAQEVQRLNYRFQTMSSEPNPYGLLPFVPTFASPPTTGFWQNGANDLAMIQAAINRRLSDLWFVLDFQSAAVFYATGAKPPKGTNHGIADVSVGPGAALFLPENAKIGFASPQAAIMETLAAIEFLVKQAAVSNGLSASSVTTDPVEESGVAKIVGNSELMELRNDDIAAFAKVERQLFEVFRTVWNVHNPGQQISSAATLTVDFYDPTPTVSPTDKVKEWAGLLELGLISPVDILIEKNPDLSRDDARAELLRIKDELREFQSINFV